MIRVIAVLSVALVVYSDATGDQIIHPHVFNGRDAAIDDFPYMASLSVNGKFQHSATIISPKYALTLSSLLDTNDSATITLRTGSAFRESGGKLHFVKKVVPHPQYKPKTFDYDYALLEVEPPFAFNQQCQPAVLPKQGYDLAPYTRANVSGWGVTKRGEEGYSMNLKFAEVSILSDDACKLLNKKWIEYTKRMVCANIIAEEKNPCAGDRGGPLVAGGILVGIVVSDVCEKGMMQSNIYAKVADQRSWIDSVVGNIDTPYKKSLKN